MLAFADLIYLDVPKTGSTRIAEVLRAHLAGPFDGGVRHRPLPRADRRPRLLSVRDPAAWYRSLFAYGCARRGRVLARLAAAGQEGLYDPTMTGFARWLHWILDPDHGSVLGHGYAGRLPELIGFASFEVLRMALPGSHRILPTLGTRHDITVRFAHPAFAPDALIRCEHLEDDLLTAVRDLNLPLKHGRPGLKRALAAGIRTNASPLAESLPLDALPPDLTNRIATRDWLLHDQFGYARPTPARAA